MASSSRNCHNIGHSLESTKRPNSSGTARKLGGTGAEDSRLALLLRQFSMAGNNLPKNVRTLARQHFWAPWLLLSLPDAPLLYEAIKCFGYYLQMHLQLTCLDAVPKSAERSFRSVDNSKFLQIFYAGPCVRTYAKKLLFRAPTTPSSVLPWRSLARTRQCQGWKGIFGVNTQPIVSMFELFREICKFISQGAML